MNEPTSTLIGNLTDDPQLRYTPNGAAVANFTVAVNIRRYDKQQNQYVDAGTLFHRCSAWKDLAENISESLTKGTRVVAHVQARPNTYETKEGETRHTTEYDVLAIGPDLRYATARATKTQRNNAQGFTNGASQGTYGSQGGSGQPNGWGAPQGGSQGGFGGSPTDDPWATGGHGQSTEQPF